MKKLFLLIVLACFSCSADVEPLTDRVQGTWEIKSYIREGRADWMGWFWDYYTITFDPIGENYGTFTHRWAEDGVDEIQVDGYEIDGNVLILEPRENNFNYWQIKIDKNGALTLTNEDGDRIYAK